MGIFQLRCGNLSLGADAGVPPRRVVRRFDLATELLALGCVECLSDVCQSEYKEGADRVGLPGLGVRATSAGEFTGLA